MALLLSMALFLTPWGIKMVVIPLLEYELQQKVHPAISIENMTVSPTGKWWLDIAQNGRSIITASGLLRPWEQKADVEARFAIPELFDWHEVIGENLHGPLAGAGNLHLVWKDFSVEVVDFNGTSDHFGSPADIQAIWQEGKLQMMSINVPRADLPKVWHLIGEEDYVGGTARLDVQLNRKQDVLIGDVQAEFLEAFLDQKAWELGMNVEIPESVPVGGIVQAMLSRGVIEGNGTVYSSYLQLDSPHFRYDTNGSALNARYFLRLDQLLGEDFQIIQPVRIAGRIKSTSKGHRLFADTAIGLGDVSAMLKIEDGAEQLVIHVERIPIPSLLQFLKRPLADDVDMTGVIDAKLLAERDDSSGMWSRFSGIGTLTGPAMSLATRSLGACSLQTVLGPNLLWQLDGNQDSQTVRLSTQKEDAEFRIAIDGGKIETIRGSFAGLDIADITASLGCPSWLQQGGITGEVIVRSPAADWKYEAAVALEKIVPNPGQWHESFVEIPSQMGSVLSSGVEANLTIRGDSQQHHVAQLELTNVHADKVVLNDLRYDVAADELGAQFALIVSDPKRWVGNVSIPMDESLNAEGVLQIRSGELKKLQARSELFDGDVQIIWSDDAVSLDAAGIAPERLAGLLGHAEVVSGGEVDGNAKLAWSGPLNRREMDDLNGKVALELRQVQVQGVALDKIADLLTSSTEVNLLDVGAIALAGPLGALITKGGSVALAGAGGDGNATMIMYGVLDATIRQGVAHLDEAAFTTGQNRFAMKGKIDLRDQTFMEGFEVALVDKKGCARSKRKIQGPLNDPELEKAEAVKLIQDLGEKTIKQVGRLIGGGGECKPFYQGRVPAP